MRDWLEVADKGIVPADGVLRRQSMDALAQIAAVQARSARRLEAAEQEAAQLAARAEQAAQAVRRLGYAQGRADGLRQWHADLARQASSAAARQARQQARLAELVATVVSRLVGGAGDAFYPRALEAINTLGMPGGRPVLRVHPADAPQAAAACAKLREASPAGIDFRLESDESLPPCSCICESESAYVDASLAQQLAAMRAAIAAQIADIVADASDGPGS